jgi:hypothetical protein
MSPILIIVLIIVVLVVIAAIVYGVQVGRRKKLQSTFGPEYDRAVADSGNRTEAEKELREREKRHAELELKPLSPESQAKYSADWEEVQLKFVDDPAEAVGTADDLVTRLITERGYPTRDYEDRLADLSVEHARTLGHYRDAHEISERNRSGEASTEDLRQALVHYRALFADLLGTDPAQSVDSAPVADRSEPVEVSDSSDLSVSDADPAAERSDAATTEDTREAPAPAPRKAADDTPTTASDTSR